MFYYLLLAAAITPFFFFQGHIMVKNKIMDSYQKCKQLKTVVQNGGVNRKGNCKAMYITTKLICKMLWIMFLQYINSTMRKVDRKTSESRELVQFELVGALDQANKKIPKRQVTRKDFAGVGTFINR